MQTKTVPLKLTNQVMLIGVQIWARLRHLSVDTAIRVVDEERVRFLKENEKVEDIPVIGLILSGEWKQPSV